MAPRRLGHTGIEVSPIGYGAFKIGRNEGIKYADDYDLPDESQVERLLGTVLDLGINYIDTAPAYGLSEERIGRAIGHRRSEYVLSTKVGESFVDGQSVYDFSARGVRASVQESLKRLGTEVIDVVFIHSDGNDVRVLQRTDVVETLQTLRVEGLIRAIGLSSKTVQGARSALEWAQAIMVEYHLDDRSHEEVIAQAAQQGVGVVVKKGLASGQLPAEEAIRFVLGTTVASNVNGMNTPGVSSLLVSSLNVNHLRENIRAAESLVSKA